MKIVYVYPQFAHLAGTERVLIDKMNYLADIDGIEITMVTYEQGSHPIAYPLSPKVVHIDLNVCLSALYKKGLIERLLKRHYYINKLHKRFNQLMFNIRPDIVIAVTYYASILTMINACPVQFVKVIESHIDKNFILSNDPLMRQNLKLRIRSVLDMKVLNIQASKFDILVALNKIDADIWSKYINTRVISNVVHLNDTSRYSDQRSKRIIFVGRYTIQKGIPELFKIWELVFNKHPDWHLDLYGDGDIKEIPYTEEYRKNKNIHVHSSDPDIFSRYIESSIFVLTSLYEPFGLVIVEAMSCGLPVIAFDCPSGPANIINDGVDGFIIKNRDIDEFANKVCMLIESPSLRLEMGKAAILSSQRFSPEKIMPQWLYFFKELLANPKP